MNNGYPELPPNKARSTNLEPMTVTPIAPVHSSNGNGHPKTKLSKAERIIVSERLKKEADELSKQGRHKEAHTLAFKACEIALGVGYGPFKKTDSETQG